MVMCMCESVSSEQTLTPACHDCVREINLKDLIRKLLLKCTFNTKNQFYLFCIVIFYRLFAEILRRILSLKSVLQARDNTTH